MKNPKASAGDIDSSKPIRIQYQTLIERLTINGRPDALLPQNLSFGLLILGFLLVLFHAANTAFPQGNYERPPIDYLNKNVNDAVAKLGRRLESGESTLKYSKATGYLEALLRELEIPISSQALVFSKTSLQLQRISPRRPRALYFNDNVYVGYCVNGDVLEIASTDAQQGAIFYTLEQKPEKVPKFVRDRGSCLTCHASSRTQQVPGYLMRSVYSDAAGRPKYGSGTFTNDVTSIFSERWGGWYVTGQHGAMRHMGNTICKGDEHTFDRNQGANLQTLDGKFPAQKYLSEHSDIVALMVLEHQSQMHNAIAFANYETRNALHQSYEMNRILERPEGFVSESALRRIESAAGRVVEHLLFCKEFQLTDQIVGSTDYAREFMSMGKRDHRGRSLRDFDLKTRTFRYPCSYLIYSESFAALPDLARHRVFERLLDILRGHSPNPEYSHLSASDRRDILEILMATHTELRLFAQSLKSNAD